MSQAPDSKLPRHATFSPAAAALLLALLAPALGGATSPFAIALLLSGIGLAGVVLPATRLRPGFLLGAALLLALTLTWAWPASLNHLPWRDRLEAAGFALPWSSSPEPWVSLRAWLLLLAGLVWAGWCAGQPWTSRDRSKICEGLAIGIGLIAALALAARERHVPGWPPGTGLGPFANRNQSAMLFATGAFLTVASGAERFRGHRRPGIPPGLLIAMAIGWLSLLGIYTAALALDKSRSGPLLFAGMTIAWSLTVMPGWKRKPETAATAVAVLLLLATLFLLTGRSVITRLTTSPLMDFRLKIFGDTLRMIRASPWTGAGLGCFDAIFPLYRNASILQERVIHPESDWLWLAAEAGLPALLAMAGLVAWMAAQAWRALTPAEDRPIRLAVCVACLGFLAHSLVDVPGHRLGTIMPALLLLGLAAAAGGPDSPSRPFRPSGPFTPSLPTAWPLRLAALAVLLPGAACLTAIILKIPIPLANGQPSLEWTPLDWRLHAVRANSEAAQGELSAALGDFRRARFLEPNFAGLPYEEGLCWLEIAPQFAIGPWREALRRIPAERRAELYQNMLAKAFPSHRELHADLWSMASQDPAMELLCLGWAPPDEVKAHMDDILREDPGLTRFNRSQLRTLFSLWMAKGDAQRLALTLPHHPAWLKAGYRALAEYLAANGDFLDAVDVMDRYLPAPSMPSTLSIPPAEAATRFQQDPGDIAAGLALYHEAIAAGRDADALDTVRTIAANVPCPPCIHYLEAQLLAKQGKLPEAWAELEKCPDPR